MKFAEHLFTHITPEWRIQYIDYEYMKQIIYSGQNEISKVEICEITEIVDENERCKYIKNLFFDTCHRELEKVDSFYQERVVTIKILMDQYIGLYNFNGRIKKLIEAKRRLKDLLHLLKLFLEKLEENSKPKEKKINTANIFKRLRKHTNNLKLDREKRTVLDRHHLKLAFSEYYLSLAILQDFKRLNFTGFRKILKKFDKIFQSDEGSEWMDTHIHNSFFKKDTNINKLILDTEDAVIKHLENKDRSKAMKRLRVPPIEEKANPTASFRTGVFLGLSACITILITIKRNFYVIIINKINDVINLVFQDGRKIMQNTHLPSLVQLFRIPIIPSLHLLCVSVNTYTWRKHGINHVLIFGVNPRDNLGFISLLEFKVFLAPYFPVSFSDFWIADQLTSLTVLFQDIAYAVYYFILLDYTVTSLPEPKMDQYIQYVSLLITSMLPSWLRMAQCLRRYRDTKKFFPHFVNAGKYFSQIISIIFLSVYFIMSLKYPKFSNVFFIVAVVTAFMSFLYKLLWDYLMDWSLFQTWKFDTILLREDMGYNSKFAYYFAIITNFFGRLQWVVAYVLIYKGLYNIYLSTMIAVIEIFRRFIWNFFRLENEHLNNCGEFRAVRDISIKPESSRYNDESPKPDKKKLKIKIDI
ncbi:hypothetical protein A3Q56_03573 [Intoshia linei]|uniref:Xenotropic and polytropic retrovirus receptor 1 n=1 Tax=Intoshia linei TaxID=1819745 RepID=A0A177B5F2_9BILA|nr:hypothetical protein A3Q56_03573 [Intoshia linei]